MAIPRWLRERSAFWRDALKGGGSRLVWILGFASLVTGVTVAAICAFVFHLSVLLVLVIALALILAIQAEGSFRLWRDATSALSG
jgi:hypothetical protein